MHDDARWCVGALGFFPCDANKTLLALPTPGPVLALVARQKELGIAPTKARVGIRDMLAVTHAAFANVYRLMQRQL